MSARILDGKALARVLQGEVRREAAALRAAGVQPTLAIVDASGDPAALQYLERKRERARALGIEARVWGFDPDLTQRGLEDLVSGLAADPGIHGIIIEQPFAPRFERDAVLAALPPAKDVDGSSPASQGLLAFGTPRFVPATALAAVTLLERSDIPLAGRDVVVVGCSVVIGRPVALLLLAREATVTICHRETEDLAHHTRRADVLVVAAGQAGLVRGHMVQPGATVIDVGTNVVGDRTVGDVAFDEVAAVAGALSPVPGGVGPLTTALLLQNTCRSAAAQRDAGR